MADSRPDPRPAKSWNHRVHRMPLDEEQGYARRGWTCAKSGPGRTAVIGRERCPQRAKWVIAYDYVTGKSGRVTSAQRCVCDAHAERFAEQHGLTLVEVPERPGYVAGGDTRLFDEIKVTP